MKNLLFLCSIIMIAVPDRQTAPNRQGMSGIVYLQQGNNMPVPGRKVNKGAPVSRMILVYEITSATQVTGGPNFYTAIQTKLIAKAQSDADGKYAIALPAGNYSVFVQENGLLYANDFDGKGNICPVTVATDNITKKDISINHGAIN